MKNLILMLVIMALTVLFSAVVYSEEKVPELSDDYGQYKEYGLPGMKDQCLIVARNCVGDDTVLKRV